MPCNWSLFAALPSKTGKQLSAWCTSQLRKMQRHLVAPACLINGWRWRTHVVALMRQFVQFCMKTMAVHFIAMCLQGYISTAASLYGEEFSPMINQKMLAYKDRWHYCSLFYGAHVGCSSIWMPSLKSVSYCVELQTQSRGLLMLLLWYLPLGMQKGSSGYFTHCALNIHISQMHKTAENVWESH